MNKTLWWTAGLRRMGALATAAGLVAGCATPLEAPVKGYLCCNAQNDYGWIYSTNYLGGPLVPLGQPVTLLTQKRSTMIYGTVGDSSFGFGHGSARNKADTLAWAKTLVVTQDPAILLDTYPAPVRAAILSARVFTGMTREQVRMAIGAPTPSDDAKADPAVWRYWTRLDDEPVDLTFDASNVLTRIVGSPAALKLVQMPR